MASVQETAIVYAALILQDEKIEITVILFFPYKLFSLLTSSLFVG